MEKKKNFILDSKKMYISLCRREILKDNGRRVNKRTEKGSNHEKPRIHMRNIFHVIENKIVKMEDSLGIVLRMSPILAELIT